MLFPPEMIKYASESHFSKHNKRFIGIYLCIVVLLLGIFTCLPFIHVSVSIKSPGIIRTASESSEVRTSLTGQVIKSNIREGASVKKGDTLLILRSESIHEKIELLENQFRTNQTYIMDLLSLTSGKATFLSAKYQHEKHQYEATVEKLLIDVNMYKQAFDMQKLLYEKNVSSKTDYLKSKNYYDLSLSQLRIHKKQNLNRWESELSQLKLENKSIQSSIKQLIKELNQYVITAPVTGSLQQVSGTKEGSFIVTGQILAKISPDENLLVECYVLPTDIGYLKLAQPTIVQISTYNFHQWGSISAEILQISEDVTFIENQPVFKVRCKLHQSYLRLKTGQKGKLKKGMTSTCRFTLTERTLFQLLFDKIEDWINPGIMTEN